MSPSLRLSSLEWGGHILDGPIFKGWVNRWWAWVLVIFQTPRDCVAARSFCVKLYVKLYVSVVQVGSQVVRRLDLAAGFEFSSPPSFSPSRGFRQLSYFAVPAFFALIFAHRAFWAAAIFLRAAADKVFLLGILTTLRFCAPFALTLAHRARCAAAIRARAAALNVGRWSVVDPFELALPPSALIAAFNLFRSFCNRSRSDFRVCNTFIAFSALGIY